jgi:hypothetical protein
MTLVGVLGLGGLLWAGAGTAKAQLFLNTPGFSLGVGAPGVGVYPYPVAPLYGAYPVPVVRPYPYAVGRPLYGPRPYGPYGYPHHGGYRRW